MKANESYDQSKNGSTDFGNISKTSSMLRKSTKLYHLNKSPKSYVFKSCFSEEKQNFFIFQPI